MKTKKNLSYNKLMLQQLKASKPRTNTTFKEDSKVNVDGMRQQNSIRTSNNHEE